MDLREKEFVAETDRKSRSLPPIRLQDIGLPKLLLIVAAGVALLVLSIPGGYRNNSTGTSGQKNVGEANDTATAMEIYTDKKEEQLKKILQQVAGIGKVEVMITLDSAEEKSRLMENTRIQKVEGVLVVAEGAGDAQTDAEIIRAVQALFSLESHKIRVMKME